MKLAIARSPRLGPEAGRGLSPLLGRIAAGIPPRGAVVEVVWIGARRMARLNRTYKGRRGACEILTFPGTGGVDPGGEASAGEIYLCHARLVAGARRREVSARAYAARLLVHGLLHLRGYGHGDRRREARMEAAEKRALGPHLSPREIERLFA